MTELLIHRIPALSQEYFQAAANVAKRCRKRLILHGQHLVEVCFQRILITRQQDEYRYIAIIEYIRHQAQQVRSEIAKVVWPTRREVMLTTIMVFIMAALTATFFSLVDMTIRFGLTLVLNAFH